MERHQPRPPHDDRATPHRSHRRTVGSVAFSPNGHTLAAGSYDGRIRLWNVTNPAHPTMIGQPLTGPTSSSIYSVAFSPDGYSLAAGSTDGRIRLWNVSDPSQATQIGRPLTGPTVRCGR